MGKKLTDAQRFVACMAKGLVTTNIERIRMEHTDGSASVQCPLRNGHGWCLGVHREWLVTPGRRYRALDLLNGYEHGYDMDIGEEDLPFTEVDPEYDEARLLRAPDKAELERIEKGGA